MRGKNFFFRKRKLPFLRRSFTIIELIVVIAIISVLASIVLLNINGILQKADVSAAGSIQREMTKAVELYYADMGFYPPDVNRGWDPGLVKPVPWSPDAPSSGGFSAAGAVCTDCPDNWQDIVTRNWAGPYLAQWPQQTPWGGKYDYNYWADTSRYGCPVAAGIYMGVERNYDDVTGTIPASAEQQMVQYGFDINCSANGEAQMPLKIF